MSDNQTQTDELYAAIDSLVATANGIDADITDPKALSREERDWIAEGYEAVLRLSMINPPLSFAEAVALMEQAFDDEDRDAHIEVVARVANVRVSEVMPLMEQLARERGGETGGAK